MFYSIDGDLVVFNLKIQPNSSQNKISGIYGDGALKINIKAPAVEGAANKELIKFLHKTFKVPKSSVVIKGENSKNKKVSLPMNEKIIEFLESF